jgi:hypothetical protein
MPPGVETQVQVQSQFRGMSTVPMSEQQAMECEPHPVVRQQSAGPYMRERQLRELLCPNTGTVTITGSVYAAGSVVGLLHSASTNNVTINGNAVGGTTITAYGVSCTSTGNITITGAAISADSPGLGAGVAVTGSGSATVGSMVTGTSGVSPCVGHVHVADLSAFTALVRSSSSSVTLSAEVGLPSPFEPSPVFGGA